MRNRKNVGDWGEETALQFLTNRGFKILETNWRCMEGEIDIVVEKDGCIRFVEVKTRTSDTFGPPEESLTGKKALRIRVAAWKYLEHVRREDAEIHFDLIAIEATKASTVKRFEYYRDIIEIGEE